MYVLRNCKTNMEDLAADDISFSWLPTMEEEEVRYMPTSGILVLNYGQSERTTIEIFG